MTDGPKTLADLVTSKRRRAPLINSLAPPGKIYSLVELKEIKRGTVIPDDRVLLVIRPGRSEWIIRTRMLVDDRWVCPTASGVSEDLKLYRYYCDVADQFGDVIRFFEERHNNTKRWK